MIALTAAAPTAHPKDTEPRLAFIICTEAGRLEGESILLARSLRKFGGNLRDAPILSIEPRRTLPLSRATLRAFDEAGVTHIRAPLNIRHAHYALANKPYAAAFVEKNFDYDVLVFLDSDKAVLSEPDLLTLRTSHPVALRPVHKKLLGTTGDDENAAIWIAMYQTFGITSRSHVETTAAEERILAYWNSGLVAARRDCGLMSCWLACLQRLMDANVLPPGYGYFCEQFSLTMAIELLRLPVLTLPEGYNYPIILHNEIRGRHRIDDWDAITTIHYHEMFRGAGWRHPLTSLNHLPIQASKCQWLLTELHATKVFRNGLFARIRRITEPWLWRAYFSCRRIAKRILTAAGFRWKSR